MLKPFKECQKFILIFILIISFEFSKEQDCNTDCTGTGLACTGTCGSNCKPKYGSPTCYDCSGITGSYYTIDSNDNCLNQCLGDKIIDTTKECTYELVNSLQKLGDVYYSTAPTSATCTSNICTCDSYYYLEMLNGKKIYTCFSTISAAVSASYPYYNYKTMQCFRDGCPDGFIVQKQLSSPNAIRCSDKCINNEYLLSEEDANGIITDYCVDSCNGASPHTGYNLKYTDNGVKKCLNACPSGMYEDDSTSECITLDNCDFYDGTTCYASCPSTKPYHKYGSKECISACPTTGDYIYKTSPDDNICYRKEDCDYVSVSGTTYTCLSSCVSGEFHDNNSKLCITRCGLENANKKYYADGGDTCYLSCSEIPGGDYIYESIDDTNGNKICYANKPSCTAFYRKVNGVMKCSTLENCFNTLHYKYLIYDECKNSCDGYYQIELKITGPPQYSYIKCFFTIDDALSDSDVNFCDTSQGKCWTTFPDVNSYFIKSEFSTASGKYEITRQCENFYYEKANPLATSQTVNWCTDDCKNIDTSTHMYFVNGNKKCLSSCSDVFKYYYDDDNNECLDSCELKSNKQFSNLATVVAPNTLPTPVKCLASCDNTANGLYYDFDSHFCLASCSDSSKNYLYHLDSSTGTDYTYKCYPSCLDIPGGIYKYELNNNLCTDTAIAINSLPTADYDYYYKKSDGVIKYVKIIVCSNLNYLYLVDKECKSSCDDSLYKMNVDKEISSSPSTTAQFTVCFSQASDCLDERTSTSDPIYYNRNLKKCWNAIANIPTNYYIKKESNDIYELVDECDNYYYEQSTYKYCISDCNSSDNPSTTDKYFITGNKECLSLAECFTLGKKYYDPSNNECVDTCKGRSTYKFQNELTGSETAPIACLDTCTFYDSDSNICLSACGDGDPNKKVHADGQNVCYASCADIPGGEYIYEDSGVCYNSASTCNYYYLKANGEKKCSTIDDCYTKNYKYFIADDTITNFECRENCDGYFKYEVEKTISGANQKITQCYDSLTKVQTDNTIKYYNIISKLCWDKYPTGYYISSSSSTSPYEVVKECEFFYYKNTVTEDSVTFDKYFCVDQCTTSYPYFDKNQKNCENTCIKFNKYFYDDTNKECLNTCKGRSGKEFSEPETDVNGDLIYKCINDCSSATGNTFHDFDSNICMDACGSNNPNYLYHILSGTVCYPSCKHIIGGSYLFESETTYDCYQSNEITTSNCKIYYPKNDGTKKCISDTSSETCYTKGFDYILGNECRENCDNYYILMDESDVDTKECFKTLNEAKTSAKGINYFHTTLKQCWINYPTTFFIKDKIENNNKFEIVDDCDKFYYEVTSGTPSTTFKYCTDNCKSINLNLFFEQGNDKCESSCTSFTKNYYNPTNNECLKTCKQSTNLQYALPLTSTTDTKECLEKCPNYFITKTDTSDSSIEYLECVDSCPITDTTTGTNYAKLDIKTKECLTACSTDNHFDFNDGLCYPKCDVSQNLFYINTDTYECVLACPTDLQKIVKIGTDSASGKDIFLCKSICDAPKEYRLGDECVENCPSTHNYIGNNKICRSEDDKCAADPNGEHFYPFNDDSYPNLPTIGYFIYKCINSCSEATINSVNYFYYTKSNPNECLRACQSDSPNYLSSNQYECLSGCPEELPFFDKPNNNYECIDSNPCPSSDPYFYEGDCVADCSTKGKNYFDSKKRCIDICPDNQYKKLDATTNTYECKEDCGSEYILEGSEPECVEDCPDGKNFIGKDNVCKSSCGEEDGTHFYLFTEITTPTSYNIYKCVDDCNYGGFIYKENNERKECFDKCTTEYPYLLSEERKCYRICLNSIRPFSLTTQDGSGNEIKICSDKCIDTYYNNIYYKEDKICISSCGSKITDYDNACVDKCGTKDSEYKFLLVDKCVNDCGRDTTISPPRPRYSTDDYICKEKCGEGTYAIEVSNQCNKTCNGFINSLTDTNNEETGEKSCEPYCSSIGKFYYKTERICLSSCRNSDKAVENLANLENSNMCVDSCNNVNDGNKYYLLEGSATYGKCVTSCPSTKPYIYNDECVDQCPTDKKYFVDSNINSDKECLIDCPSDYPYYKEITDSNSKVGYQCSVSCSDPEYYVPNMDSNENAKLCLSNCPDSSYPQYKYKYVTEDARECYENCPDHAKYHLDLTSTPTDNNCYKECPDYAPYHEEGKTICKKQSELSGGFLLYDTKIWTNSRYKCPDGYPLITHIDDNSGNSKVTVCLKECNFYFHDDANPSNPDIRYGYVTPYNTCVADCANNPTSLTNNKYLINNPDTNNPKCICAGYFYIDETTFEMTCYPSTITSCQDTANPGYNGYILPLNGTMQCLKNCNERILNPSGDICYELDISCSDVDIYSTLKITSTGQKKCDCAYKFYDDSGSGKKICLSEVDVCPQQYNLLIPYPGKLQCVASCPPDYPYLFKNFCLLNCPLGSTPDGNNCKCGIDGTVDTDFFWYERSAGNYECLNGAGCPDGFPLYAPTTHQCLKSCKDSFYFKFFFEYKCFDTCNQYPNMIETTSNSIYAEYQCFCNKPWYYFMQSNEKKVHCPADSDSINRCEDYDPTQIELGYEIPFMIAETGECVKECPSNYPYYFNHKCYDSCENADTSRNLNIKTASSSFECACKNLWYIDPDNIDYQDKLCYNEDIDECPPSDSVVPSTRHLIYETKKCVDSVAECKTSSFKFNLTCYDKCPEFTLDVEDSSGNKICKCDTTYYLYLEYEKYGNTYYRCGLKSCPDEFIVNNQEEMRKNLLKSENKCVKFCKNDGSPNYIWSFRNICVTECPYLTNPVSGDGINEDNECKFYDIEDETSTVVIDLNKLKNAANIQAKELYEDAGSISGYLMNKFDASMQIYAVDKLHDYKDYIMQSNLTYIDLGTCLDKIYQANNLDDGDKLLIAKYDLLTRAHYDNNGNIIHYSDEKYLINPVEYEFYLESTMDKIEGSICSPHEIEISYPIFFNKNKFNNFQNGINDNIYLKQFLMGKELNSKNSEIDTFNKDNKVYKDLCTGAEINGKDLVFEDRYYTLYPNNVSLCESNCTMKNTDYDLERINCLCTYKEIMDFDRIDEDNNDLLNNPDFYKPSQSSANVEVVKCISKIGVKEGLVNNEAFYIIGSFALIEIAMMIISFAHSLKYIARFIRGLIWNNEAKSAFSLQKNNQIMSSTHRLLNNPPKKGEENDNNNEEEEKEESNKGNIVIKKNIKMNYNKNNNNDNDEIKDEISEMSINNINNNISNSSINYNLNIKPGLPKSKNKNNNLEDMNYSKSKFIIKNNNTNTNNANGLYTNKKAEFIPLQYNFKFFKPEDKGIIKQIERSKIPFRVNKDTKILLEGKKNVLYDEDYLKGPFYQDQNIIEIIDEPDNAQTQKTIKFTHLNNNLNSDMNNTNNNIIKKNNNKKNEVEKSIEEETPKKKTIINNINSAEKDFIKIKKINPIENLQIEDYKTDDEVKNVDRTTSIYNLMRREHTYLRVTYEKYTSKNHPNILATFLAEILDKIYFIKIFIFLKKFDIFSIHLALYMFYHIFLLSLLCGFFTIKTIKKIWEESDFPNLSFYLLYGLIANIIVWVFYKVFILLLDNQDKIRALVRFHKESINSNISRNKMEENNEMNNENEINENKINNINNQQDIINERYEELVKKIKIQTIIFYIIILLLSGFFYIYLVSFFAIYTGTKRRVLTAYYVSIIEIILIKFVYGLCLASLRIAGEVNELKSLYKFVYIMDKYVS